jgi:hypothetical protein
MLGKQDPGSVTSPAEKKPMENDVMSSCWNWKKGCHFTPKRTEGQERSFCLYADPWQGQDARDEGTRYPCRHDACIVGDAAAAESPKERSCNRDCECVQSKISR